MKRYLERIYKKDKASFYQLVSNDLKNNHKRFIVTVNPETLMIAQNDEKLHDILLDKKVTLTPDGIAIIKACKKLGIQINERIAGIDIAQYLLELANKKSYSLYLYGAKEEVIKLLVDRVNREYPHIKLLGFSNGYVKNKDKVMNDVVKLKPDICLVALGIPEQEKIIYKYLDKFTKGLFVGVGGSFDVMSGMKKRAPKIFIKTNTEWLYRIVKEPKRLKRFWNNNVKFMFSVRKMEKK